MTAHRLSALSAILVSAAASMAGAQHPNTISFEEGEEGWMLLFYGRDLDGWSPTADADWQVRDGEIVASSGSPSLLLSYDEYRDFELKVDFLAAPGTNSGVFFRVPGDGRGEMYELNIAPPENPFPTGSLMRVKVGEGGPSFGLTARHDGAGRASGDDWRSYHLIVEGGHFEIKLDGVTIVELDDPEPLPPGRIGLQHNQGPIAFRNLKIRPLAW
jgi:hypothetical protein